MTYFAYQGTLLAPATASTVTYTDPGFQPKAIIFWTGATTSAADAADAAMGIGFNGDASATGQVGQTTATNLSTTTAAPTSYNTTDGNNNSIQCFQGATLRLRGVVSAYTATGFTVVWNTVTPGAFVHYLALGGTDITNVESRSFSITATGSQKVTFATAFQPDLLLFACSSGVSTFGNGIGAATGPTNRWACGWSANGGATMASTNLLSFVQDTTKAIICLNGAGVTTTRCAADLTSMDSNGFTLNVTIASASVTVRYLAIKGGTYKAGNFAKAANTTQTSITVAAGASVPPVAYLLSGIAATGNTASQTGWRGSFGATDGTRASSISWEAKTSVLPSQARRITDDAATLSVLKQRALPASATVSGAVEVELDHNSFTADGFVVNVPTNTVATAFVYPYVTFAPTRRPEPTDPYGALIYNTTGLRHYWRFNEASGQVADYGGGPATNLTVNGTPVRQAPSLADLGNSGLQTDGTTAEYCSAVPPDVSRTAAQPFSAEIWFRNDAGGGFLSWPIFSSGWVYGTAYSGFGISAKDNGVGLNWGNGTVWAGANPPTIPYITANAWHHAVLTYDGTTGIFYVDGAEAYRSTTAHASANSNLYIAGGFGPLGAATQYAGTVDEAAYYHVALSPAQVQEHYAAGIGIQEPTNPVAGPSDPFSTAPLNSSLWTTWGTGVKMVSGSELQLQLTGISGEYGGIISNTSYDFTNKVLRAHIATLPTPQAGLQTYIRAEIDDSNGVVMGYEAGNLFCQREVGGVVTTVKSVAWPTGTQGLRITFDNAQSLIWFSTSTNGSTWVNQHNEALPIATTALKVVVGNGAYATVTPSGTAWHSIGETVWNYHTHNLAGALAKATVRAQPMPDAYGAAIAAHANLATYWRLGDGRNYPDMVKGSLGLVGYWRLEEASGTTAADSSGNNYTGTWSGSYTLGTPGQVGAGATLADPSWCQVADAAPLRTPTSNVQWTMEAMVKPATLTGVKTILRKDAGAGGYFLRLGNAALGSFWALTGGTYVEHTGGTIPDTTNWHHVVATYDGATIRHFIDGVQVSSVAETRTLAFSTAALAIGAQGPSGGEQWVGGLDEVAVYNRAHTLAMAQARYDASGKVALDHGPGPTKRVGTYVGSPTQGAPGAIATSNDKGTVFDTGKYVSVPDFAITGAFTVELWYYATAYPAGGSTLINRRTAADLGGFTLDINEFGQLYFWQHNGTAWVNCNTSRYLAGGNWHYIAISYDGAGNYINVNGQGEAFSGSIGTMANPASCLIQIGRNIYSGNPFVGTIDELAVYNTNLDLATMQAHYRLGAASVNTYEATVGAETGLVAYWPCNESAGGNSFDVDGNGYTLEVGTGVSRGASTDGLQLAGPFAANYDNTGESYMRRPIVDAGLGFGTGDFSVELWCKQPALTNGPLIEWCDTSASAFHIWQYPSPDQVYVNYDGAAVYTLQTAALLVPDQWHHIVALREGNNARVYVDGSLAASGALFSGTNLPFGRPVQLGFRQVSAGPAAHYGWLDQVAIYNVALTAPQIADHYAKGVQLLAPGEVLVRAAAAVAAGAVLLGTVTAQRPAAPAGVPATVAYAARLPTPTAQRQAPITAVQATAAAALAGGLAYDQAVLADTPYAYWRLGEGSGTTAADTSGNGRAGEYDGTGGVAFNQAGAVAGANTAIRTFSNQGYMIVDNALVPYSIFQSDFTIEAWVKPSGASIDIISKQATLSGNGFRWQFGTSAIQFGQRADGIFVNTNGNTGLTPGVWNHIAVTKVGTTIAHYLNGVPNGGSAIPGSTAAYSQAEPFTLGYNYSLDTGGGAWYDEVAVYNTALAAPAILAHYNAGAGGGGTAITVQRQPTVAGVRGQATVAAPLPVVTDERVVQVAGTLGVANAAAPLPTSTAQRVTSVPGQLAAGTAAALLPTQTVARAPQPQPPAAQVAVAAPVPGVTSDNQAVVAGQRALANLAVVLPTVTRDTATSITGVPGQATAAVPLPTATAQQVPTVAGLPAIANTASPAPTAQALRQAAVAGMWATAVATAPIGTIVAARVPTVPGVLAGATALAMLPGIVGGISATPAGQPATAALAAPLATIAGQRQPNIVGTTALANAFAIIPSTSSSTNAGFMPPPAQALAAALTPSLAAIRNPTVAGALAQAAIQALQPTLAPTRVVGVQVPLVAAQGLVLPPSVAAYGHAQIGAVVATLQAHAPAPVPVTAGNRTVAAVAAQVSAAGLAAAIAAQRHTQVPAVAAQAALVALLPGVQGTWVRLVSPPPATAAYAALVASISGIRQPTLAAVPATAQAAVPVPGIAGARQAAVVAAVAGAAAAALAALASTEWNIAVPAEPALAAVVAYPSQSETDKFVYIEAIVALAGAAADGALVVGFGRSPIMLPPGYMGGGPGRGPTSSNGGNGGGSSAGGGSGPSSSNGSLYGPSTTQEQQHYGH